MPHLITHQCSSPIALSWFQIRSRLSCSVSSWANVATLTRTDSPDLTFIVHGEMVIGGCVESLSVRLHGSVSWSYVLENTEMLAFWLLTGCIFHVIVIPVDYLLMDLLHHMKLFDVCEAATSPMPDGSLHIDSCPFMNSFLPFGLRHLWMRVSLAFHSNGFR